MAPRKNTKKSKKSSYKKKRYTKRVPKAVKAYVKKTIDANIEDKIDSYGTATTQTFAAFSATATSGEVGDGWLTLPLLPDFSQNLTSGGTGGGYIGNEVYMKYCLFDAFITPMTNAELYGRTIKVYAIKCTGPNASDLFDVEDMFENDFVMQQLNASSYPSQFWLTPRNNLDPNFKKNYKIVRSWKFKIPNNINQTDGSNWSISKKFFIPIYRKIRYDNAGNPLDCDYRIVFTTDVGNDYSAAPAVNVLGTQTGVGNSGCYLIYQRKNVYQDA